MKRVLPRDPVYLPAARDHNATVDAIDAVEALPPRHTEPTATPDLRVRNDTAERLPRLSILQIAGPIVEPRGDRPESFFQRVNGLRGIVPDDRDRSAIVVTLAPSNPGTIVAGQVAGYCWLRVHVVSEEHTAAQAWADRTDQLQTCQNGPARILWREPTPDPLPDPDPGRWALCWLDPAVGQRRVGDVIVGTLRRDVSASTWTRVADGPAGTRRETGLSLLQVWDTDPDNELADQDRYRFPIVDWIPWDDAAEAASEPHNEIVIGYDLRNGSVIQEWWPLRVIDSTDRNGTWTVDADWQSDDRWDAVEGRYRIPIKETIPTVDADPLEPGTLLVPGAAMLKATDRHELVTNRRGLSAASNAWATAIWTGSEYELIAVSC